jgi:hypothetical protein
LGEHLPRIFDPGFITDKRLDDCGLNPSTLTIACRKALAALHLPSEIQVNLSSLVDALAEQRKSTLTKLQIKAPRVVTEAPPKVDAVEVETQRVLAQVEAARARPNKGAESQTDEPARVKNYQPNQPLKGDVAAPSGTNYNWMLLIGCNINTDHPESLDMLLRPLTQHIEKDMGVPYGCDQYNESGKRLGIMLAAKLDELLLRPSFVPGMGPYVFQVSSYRTDLPYIRAAFASRGNALIIESNR